jgi:hypothetical protein
MLTLPLWWPRPNGPSPSMMARDVLKATVDCLQRHTDMHVCPCRAPVPLAQRRLASCEAVVAAAWRAPTIPTSRTAVPSTRAVTRDGCTLGDASLALQQRHETGFSMARQLGFLHWHSWINHVGCDHSGQGFTDENGSDPALSNLHQLVCSFSVTNCLVLME